MHIVTDSGVDLALAPEEQRALNIRVVPLVVNLEGQTYREGVDITTDEFYQRLAETNALPTTSQPSPEVRGTLLPCSMAPLLLDRP